MHDVIIIGAGPAGLTAGMYAGRANLSTLILGDIYGSQLAKTSLIENYPGFEEGISGMDLITKMIEQAKIYGVKNNTSIVKEISKKDDGFQVKTDDDTYLGLSIIIASGAHHTELGVFGEEKLAHKGVSYCATCDGPLFRDKDVVVVGGGDSAVKEALFLTKFARKVSLVHRRDRLRATKILQKRASSNEKMGFICESIVTEILGDDSVNGVKIKNVKTQKEKDLACQGVFIFVGIEPATKFLKGLLDTDESGYIITDDDMVTSVDGIYACGDARKKLFRQVVTACGEGATAAFSAQQYVEELKGIAYK